MADVAKTEQELADAMGVSKSAIQKWKRAEWWRPEWKRGSYPILAIATARANNNRRHDAAATAAALRQGAAPANDVQVGNQGAVGVDASDEVRGQAIACLADPDASPVQKTHAAVMLAAIELAGAAEDHAITPKHIENLEKVMRELRRAEQDYMELQVRRGELIERAVAKTLAGMIVTECCQLLEAAAGEIGNRFQAVVADPHWRAQGTKAQARAVCDWFMGLTRSLRETTADDIEQMIRGQSE